MGRSIHSIRVKITYPSIVRRRTLETNGEEGLRDRCGRTKDEVELTVEEKLKLVIQRIELLKKLEEIKRRRR
ncbi:hypothetical protein J1907_13135 [Lysinibacillus sphaericus]|uniref:hypothetical protein n=1 Tax=Lysinibacillus sphaericus TaxID=1421 RepID=UPI00055A2E4B|nr:hypothetical protein [Lysinibacillus sphaericus]QTB20768.1 hypothetical protein J1907_13135 [Lysinibacillus sphaericus]